MTQFILYPPLEIIDSIELETFEDGDMERIIIYRAPEAAFSTLNVVAIHTLNPSEAELERHVEDAAKDGFDSIIVYGKVS